MNANERKSEKRKGDREIGGDRGIRYRKGKTSEDIRKGI
jgi:hypothetical protein